MSGGLLRPEVAAFLTRYGEAGGALGFAGLGLWLALSPGPVVAGLGWAMAAFGLAALPVALRRARYPRSQMGAGIVAVTEGRIAYMGPILGGAAALDDLQAIAMTHEADGSAVWVLYLAEGQMRIPVDARGGAALFDAFALLPDFPLGAALDAAEGRPEAERFLWRRGLDIALSSGHLTND